MINYFSDIIFGGEFDFLDFVMYLGAIAFMIFCATPLHEYAHALIAVKLGDGTPRATGRLTIRPTAHIDPIGAIMLVLFGFGYARPVQVRMRNFKKPKRDMALVALAGPVCNIIQAFLAMVLFNVFVLLSNSTGINVISYFAIFCMYAASININLAVFNLIPIPPLDGSRLLTALLPAKYYYGLMKYERYIMIGLFVLLFTGILSTPLSLLSSLVFDGVMFIAGLPFRMFIG